MGLKHYCQELSIFIILKALFFLLQLNLPLRHLFCFSVFILVSILNFKNICFFIPSPLPLSFLSISDYLFVFYLFLISFLYRCYPLHPLRIPTLLLSPSPAVISKRLPHQMASDPHIDVFNKWIFGGARKFHFNLIQLKFLVYARTKQIIQNVYYA